jgi:hypothetical protein
MGVRKRFNEIFGLEDGVEEGKRRFVERVNHVIFHDIDTEHCDEFGYRNLFDLVCFELGVNAHDFPQRRQHSLLDDDTYSPAPIRTLTTNDFDKTLLVLCTLYLYIQYGSDAEKGQQWLSKRIGLALSRCSCDIGIRWKEGFFYPSGAEELDKPLIEETLTWLKDYPNESKDYRTALQRYLEEKSLGDVIKNCYSAVEGVARKVLGNEKTLDNNKDELLAKIGLSDGWKPLLASYIKYAHDYRHASPERHDITKPEAEAYLYMTGLIIRLIIESK